MIENGAASATNLLGKLNSSVGKSLRYFTFGRKQNSLTKDDFYMNLFPWVDSFHIMFTIFVSQLIETVMYYRRKLICVENAWKSP